MRNKKLLRSPFVGLIVTGLTASAALLIESRLRTSPDVHFLLQFVWVGVVSAALLASVLRPTLEQMKPPVADQSQDIPGEATPEFQDEDRAWLQEHPDDCQNQPL